VLHDAWLLGKSEVVGARARVQEVRGEGEYKSLNGEGMSELRVLTFSVLLEKRELTVKPPLLKP